MSRETLVGDVRIRLTKANIKNSYLRVHQFGGLIERDNGRLGQVITVELEGSDGLATEVDWKKGILREREGLGAFFQKHGLKEGDGLVVEKLDDRHFAIRLDDNDKADEFRPAPKDGADAVELLHGKDQLLLFQGKNKQKCQRKTTAMERGRRANELDGREWTAYSVSVWKDIRKSSDEKKLDHPAMFPLRLVERVMQCFTNSNDKVVLDPFMGSGSTLVTACLMGKIGIGFEIYEDYVELAKQRLAVALRGGGGDAAYEIHACDASRVADILEPNSVDLVFTSPPYWDILSRPRSADNKEIRDYGSADSDVDLSRIDDYRMFVEALGNIFGGVLGVLKPGKYCVVNVMDLRKQSTFYPFHADLARELERRGYKFDDMIIWDRSHEYNNLRPLGYPAVFRVNKVHEYLLIFQKPKEHKRGRHEEEKDQS